MRLAAILLLICSLEICLPSPRPQPIQPPAVTPTQAATAPQPLPQATANPNRYYGKGPVWAGLSEFDTGYCPGFWPYEGGGGLGALSWPVDAAYREIRPERAFGQHPGYLHTGWDFDMPAGSNVYAAGGGTVVWAGFSTYGFGKLVAIHHSGGWVTLYGHLESVGVSCGQWVTAGEIVGASLGTDFEHLHFEVRLGFWAYDPLPYFP